MSFWSKIFKRPDYRGEQLYDSVVGQARQVVFFTDLGVPDTLDGRFDLIILHMCVVRQALIEAGERPEDGGLLQTMDERFIADMDYCMREVGVGDLSVGKKVKAMAGAYQGRWKRYRVAMTDKDVGALAEAIEYNVFRGGTEEENPVPETVSGGAEALAAYSLAQVASLSDTIGALRDAAKPAWTAFQPSPEQAKACPSPNSNASLSCQQPTRR